MARETIEACYRRRTPRSREIFDGGAHFLAGPAKGAFFHPPYPLALSKAEGCRLWDVDGQAYVDFANHHTTQVLGPQRQHWLLWAFRIQIFNNPVDNAGPITRRFLAKEG